MGLSVSGRHFLIVLLDGSDKKLSRAIADPAHSALKAIESVSKCRRVRLSRHAGNVGSRPDEKK